MRVYDKGIYRDATPEEEAELLTMQEEVSEDEFNLG